MADGSFKAQSMAMAPRFRAQVKRNSPEACCGQGHPMLKELRISPRLRAGICVRVSPENGLRGHVAAGLFPRAMEALFASRLWQPAVL